MGMAKDDVYYNRCDSRGEFQFPMGMAKGNKNWASQGLLLFQFPMGMAKESSSLTSLRARFRFNSLWEWQKVIMAVLILGAVGFNSLWEWQKLEEVYSSAF